MRCAKSNTNHLLICLSPLLTLLSVKANLILDSIVVFPLANAATTSPAAEALVEDDSHLSNSPSLIQVLLSALLGRFAINKVTLHKPAGSVLTKGIKLNFSAACQPCICLICI
jgi:hypothetical protein